jgi:hypothetical protein
MSTTLTVDRSRVVGNRLVYTYWPEGAAWYTGLLTGHGDDDGGFVLEHVVAFTPGTLLPLLRAGIAEAQALGYRRIRFGIPDAFPTARALGRAARAVGCAPYARAEGWTYYARALDA